LRGADGIKLADVNGDGLQDGVSAGEFAGLVRVYINPGPVAAEAPWPSVVVGSAPDAEDATFADLDGDGAVDVISSSEKQTRRIFVHWAPADPHQYLDPAAWSTGELPASLGKKWMYAEAAQLDGRNGPDLIAGGKGEGAEVGWFEAPADPRDLAQWLYHPLAPASWVMTLDVSDMDGDLDADVLVSDRAGALAGVSWFENVDGATAWAHHPIHGVPASFLGQGDIDGDGLVDMAAAALRAQEVVLSRRLDARGTEWSTQVITLPSVPIQGKGVAVGDIDMDGRRELVVTGVQGDEGFTGVSWFSPDGDPFAGTWTYHAVSAPDGGIKYDRPRLLDMDGDNDLDVVTTEENRQFGVIWYENPHAPRL
jgi:hypothetical protein